MGSPGDTLDGVYSGHVTTVAELTFREALPTHPGQLTYPGWSDTPQPSLGPLGRWLARLRPPIWLSFAEKAGKACVCVQERLSRMRWEL